METLSHKKKQEKEGLVFDVEQMEQQIEEQQEAYKKMQSDTKNVRVYTVIIQYTVALH